MSKRRDKKKRARKIKEKVTGKKIVARGRPKPKVAVKVRPKVDRRKGPKCAMCAGTGATALPLGALSREVRQCGNCNGTGIEPTHTAPDPVAKGKAVADLLDPEMDAVSEDELDRMGNEGGPVDPDFS